MLAVSEGDIPPSTAFEARSDWWLLELYAAAKHFSAADDSKDVQHCLEEAKQAGVIDTTYLSKADVELNYPFVTETRFLQKGHFAPTAPARIATNPLPSTTIYDEPRHSSEALYNASYSSIALPQTISLPEPK